MGRSTVIHKATGETCQYATIGRASLQRNVVYSVLWKVITAGYLTGQINDQVLADPDLRSQIHKHVSAAATDRDGCPAAVRQANAWALDE